MTGNPFWTNQKGAGCQLEYFQFVPVHKEIENGLGMSEAELRRDGKPNPDTEAKCLTPSLSLVDECSGIIYWKRCLVDNLRNLKALGLKP